MIIAAENFQFRAINIKFQKKTVTSKTSVTESKFDGVREALYTTAPASANCRHTSFPIPLLPPNTDLDSDPVAQLGENIQSLGDAYLAVVLW